MLIPPALPVVAPIGAPAALPVIAIPALTAIPAVPVAIEARTAAIVGTAMIVGTTRITALAAMGIRPEARIWTSAAPVEHGIAIVVAIGIPVGTTGAAPIVAMYLRLRRLSLALRRLGLNRRWRAARGMRMIAAIGTVAMIGVIAMILAIAIAIFAIGTTSILPLLGRLRGG